MYLMSHETRLKKNYETLNVYGQTKLEDELAISNTLDKYYIVRIA